MWDWAQGMRSRNYRVRRRADARGMKDVIAIVVSMVAMAAVFLFYAWVRNQMINMGYAEQRLQEQEKKLMASEKQLVVELQILTSPDRIDAVAADLGMVQAQPWQVIAARTPVHAPGDGTVLAMAAGTSKIPAESKKYSATN